MSAEGGLTGVSLAAGARAAAGAAEEEEEEGAPSRGGGIGAVLAVPPGAIRPGGSLALRRVEAREMDAIDDDDYGGGDEGGGGVSSLKRRRYMSAVVRLQAEGSLEALQKPAMVRKGCLRALPLLLHSYCSYSYCCCCSYYYYY